MMNLQIFENYIPCQGDRVVGTVTKSSLHFYTIDISSAISGKLPVLAFEGATKASRPVLVPGDLVYAKVERTAVGSEAVLTCKSRKRKDWSSGEATFGPLKHGTTFQLSPSYTGSLLRELNCNSAESRMSQFGKLFSFDIVLGSNGVCWANADSVVKLLTLCKFVPDSEHVLQKDFGKFLTKAKLFYSSNV